MTGFFINCVRRLRVRSSGVSVESKSLSAEKNVIAVTGSLIQVYGSLEGGVGRGSGEARSVSDTKFQKSMSCHIGLSGERQNRVNSGRNRRFLRKKGRFSGISRGFRGVLSDIH